MQTFLNTTIQNYTINIMSKTMILIIKNAYHLIIIEHIMRIHYGRAKVFCL